MINFAFLKLKEKKYIIQGIIFFLVFFALYLILDYLNYQEATIKPTTTWIVVNIFVNLIMASVSTLLMNLSTIMVEIKATGDRGANLGFISIIFGIFTYGCTGCVVVFLSAIGIAFSPTIFPFIHIWHGFLYKLLSLVLIGIGLTLVIHNIARGKCKVNFKK